MGKFLNSYDKQGMKMAMLKHEETFREQVYELHRLYKMQKLLMKKTASEKQVQELNKWNLAESKSSNPVNYDQHKRQRLSLDLERLAEEYVEDDQTELELTLGPISQCRRKKILNNTSDSAASFSSSSSTVSNHINSSNIGNDQRINTSIDNRTVHDWSLSNPGSKPMFINERKVSSEGEEQLRQNRHGNPSWLFQSSTLNSTRKNHLLV